MTPCDDAVCTVDAHKASLRHAAIARRAECDPALGDRLAERILAELPPPAGAAIGGYWPIGSEIDCRPLLFALYRRGHPIGLPVTPARGLPLSFRCWTPQAALVPGRFGTQHPDPAAITLVPDLLLVPLLAFDRGGRRLGYGGGYYDRTIAALPAVRTIGCAYAAQEIEHVPTGPHDISLHAVATERGVIRAA